MTTRRDPLYETLQASDRASRRRQSVRAVQIALCLVVFGVLMVALRVWADMDQSKPAPQGTHGGVTVNP